MFKGVELYSWRETTDDQWRFSLLPGTNRKKTLKEIKAPKSTIVGVETLKRELAHLAVGEQVMWTNPDVKQFAYPPKAVRDDVSQATQALQIHLSIPEP